MKTIEERAKDYAETRCINVESELHKRLFIDAFGSSYIQGAKEQRNIDIDKACEWFEKYLFDIGYPDDWCRDSANVTNGESRFREFMEE